jgi:hypothetical protein
VPQIAIETSYLVIHNASYVVDWTNQSLQSRNRFVDGSNVTVSGRLTPIFYNKTAGSTYPIYYSNAKGLWKPQPQLQITNATLTTQPVAVTCTTTLSFTVSGSSTGVWNLPMIPAGACYTVTNVAPQQAPTPGSTDISTWGLIVALVGVALVIGGTLVFLIGRRK